MRSLASKKLIPRSGLTANFDRALSIMSLEKGFGRHGRAGGGKSSDGDGVTSLGPCLAARLRMVDGEQLTRPADAPP